MFNHIPMGKRTIITGMLSIIIPIILFVLLDKRRYVIKKIALYSYVLAIIAETVIRRPASDMVRLNLVPFWSYKEIFKAEIRWQVYMNIFLFVPIGFLIPFAEGVSHKDTVLRALMLSIFIECSQLVLKRGLCEIDDVIHNIIGAVVGYWLWIMLCNINTMRNT